MNWVPILDIMAWMVLYTIQFLMWTFWLHVFHLTAHDINFLWYFHSDHHRQVDDSKVGFSWKNLFLFYENWKSTCDQWLIEVLPTLAFAFVMNAWWIAVFYYIWAAFIQEWVRHNPRFNAMPFLTSGQYHLKHHEYRDCNFGVFVWFWDWIGGTYEKP